MSENNRCDGKFFLSGRRFVNALKAKPSHAGTCWSCDTKNVVIIFFGVEKDCRCLGWLESGIPAQVYVCIKCADQYMNTFNMMMAQNRENEGNLKNKEFTWYHEK